METQKNVTYLELTDGAASSNQTFKYLQPPTSNKKNDEGTFIIVKPGTRQGELKLNLKSVDTEEKYDWMEILTVESQPISQFR